MNGLAAKVTNLDQSTHASGKKILSASSARRSKARRRKMADNVNKPAHYRDGDIECIDAIKAQLGDEGFINYCHGNVVKYLWRWQAKNGLEDLMKARVYLNWLIDTEEAIEGAEAAMSKTFTVKGNVELTDQELAAYRRAIEAEF